MSTESESKRKVKVINTFDADPRSQNWYGKPLGNANESLYKVKEPINLAPWIAGGLAAMFLTVAAAVGLKGSHTKQQAPQVPDIPGSELTDQTGPQRYTGEISVKISRELNIRTSPQIAEKFGSKLPNVIDWNNVDSINGERIDGLLGFRVRDALVVPGDAVEGSKLWLAGLKIKTKDGREIDGFISMSRPTIEAGYVQRDNFGTMVPAATQDGKILNSSTFEPLRAGVAR